MLHAELEKSLLGYDTSLLQSREKGVLKRVTVLNSSGKHSIPVIMEFTQLWGKTENKVLNKGISDSDKCSEEN